MGKHAAIRLPSDDGRTGNSFHEIGKKSFGAFESERLRPDFCKTGGHVPAPWKPEEEVGRREGCGASLERRKGRTEEGVGTASS